MAFLHVIKGSRPGQVLELRGERMVLGRHPSCEIVLDNAAVSRQHAQILNRRGTFFLEDLRSRNRTYLNGTPIDARTPLNDADEVTICDIVLQFFHAAKDDSTGVSTPGRPKSVPDRDDPRRTRMDATLPPTDSSDDAADQSSSIITTLDAKSAATMRLGVKPEVKLRAILEMSNMLARTLKLDDVLQSLLDGCFKVFPQADSGFVMLAAGEERESIVKAALARGGDATGSVRMSNTILRTAMQSGEAILSADALEDSRFDASESLDGLGIRSMICVPLMAKGGEALGAIQLQTQSLRQQFTQSDLDVLISVGSQAILAIENARLHEDLLRRSDIERELRFATQVQLGFLPEIRPNPPGYEFFDYYEPAERVGGDYFDYIQLNDGRIAIALADVAGKGIPAALLMARLYSSVRLHLFSQPTPAKALSALNAEIHAQGMGHRFVTFVLLTLDPVRHETTLVNAGHLPPIVRTADGQSTSVGRKESGMPLGINPEQEYREITLALESGTSVVLYTDGITESMNAANDLFGRARLENFVSSISGSSEDLTKAIVTEVDRFCGTRPQRDDMCLVCLRRLDDPGPKDDTTCPSIPVVAD
ncbi:MAG TPA: SpoIIE family protein phosphatase [Planctomycetaceae bacterium]|nr:SpoIIE family protein phosphatase [Planctomycetaceae bacterium]